MLVVQNVPLICSNHLCNKRATRVKWLNSFHGRTMNVVCFEMIVELLEPSTPLLLNTRYMPLIVDWWSVGQSIVAKRRGGRALVFLCLQVYAAAVHVVTEAPACHRVATCTCADAGLVSRAITVKSTLTPALPVHA